MNSMGIESDASFLQLPDSLTTSPSQSTFMAEEDASICPLLPNTSSPQLDFNHPLTPSTGNDINSDAPDDQVDDTSSSSSGIGMAIPLGTAYHHLRKNGDNKNPENGSAKKHGKINYDYLSALSVPLTKDIPTFVTWNWPLIRKLTFFLFLSGIFAMCSIVVAMMVNMPKTCNPETPWFHGSVFYEIFPASFKDSDNDGVGDLRGLATQVSYFQNLSIGAIRLNSIFPSARYPDDFKNVQTLMEISKELGTIKDLEYLIAVLHQKNISLILDLPLYSTTMKVKLGPSTMDNSSYDAQDSSNYKHVRVERSLIDENMITNVIRFWLAKGVDGFYMKGLENFADDQYLGENVREWKYVLGSDRIMIVNQSLINSVSDELAEELLQVIDLVDVFLDTSNGTQLIEHQVIDILNGKLKPSQNGPWIHWSINCVDHNSRVATGISPNASLAAVLMEIMLPGTPSIFYGDEISMEQSHDPLQEHNGTKHLHHLPTMSFKDQSSFTSHKILPWLPRSASVSYQHLQYVTDAITTRSETPALYRNSVNKDGNEAHGNTHIRANKNDLLIIERTYPRHNTYVSVTNLGPENLTVDISAFYYSGKLVLGTAKHNKVFFSNFKIKALETVIIKLDK